MISIGASNDLRIIENWRGRLELILTATTAPTRWHTDPIWLIELLLVATIDIREVIADLITHFHELSLGLILLLLGFLGLRLQYFKLSREEILLF